MNDDFGLLLKIYARIGPQVAGHSAAPPLLSSQMEMIERFIEGHCDASERREIAEFLQAHPAWIRWVAERVMMEREAGGASQCTSGAHESMLPENAGGDPGAVSPQDYFKA